MKTDFNPVRRSSPLVTAQPSSGWSRLQLQRHWNRFMQSVLGNPEPRITLKRDRSGEHYWSVYDPVDHRSITFWSAHEVRVWLEERYRR